MQRGALILCGGQSSRMGRDKAALPFGPEAMLQRVVRLASEVVDSSKLVIVAAACQSIPSLPTQITVAHDDRRERGPLEGMAAGFRAFAGRADAVFITGCDAPLLVPAFVERMFELLGDYEIAVPRDGDFYHPLAAVYRTTVLPSIEKLLAAGQLAPRYLFNEHRTLAVPVEELRTVDPQLMTLKNVNSPRDYVDALTLAGFGT
jgi:molybdopterin-guanine dinucleotide biosynthesis protein A